MRQGRLAICGEAAIDVVRSAEEPLDLRCHAASAIGAMANRTLHARLFEVVSEFPSIPNRLCASVAKALYPETITPSQLVRLLAKTEPVREFSIDLPFHLKFHVESVLGPNTAADLLRHLTVLAQIHLVQEKLLSLLSAGDPPNRAILGFAISVLMRQSDPPLRRLARFADGRIVAGGDPGPIPLWLAVWMHIDGDEAVERLACVLENAKNPDDIMVRLCSTLSGKESERGPFSTDPNYLRPPCLRRLIPLVFRHVRFGDDLDRTGGAYTPTARDYAQDFRGVLLNRLESDQDTSATDVLRELADDPAMAQVRDWILDLIDKRLATGADSAPWTPVDIQESAARYEVDPKNDRELFAIALNRLEDLRCDVEQSDNSPRDDLRKGDHEILLRRWLQRWLLERSQQRYVVPQEEEIDRQERPDLRLENPRFPGPVSIEIKWADDWSLRELLDGLETQLVGQYLRAHNSRYGIYLLGCNGEKRSWEEPTTGRHLPFEEVVELIREHAVSVMQTEPRVAGLEVVSLDFRPPANH